MKRRLHLALAVCCTALCGAAASAQKLTILIDPARGGAEDGARIDEHVPEKQVTLELANRLRSLLNARDFNVVLTRENDVTVTNEARAALANQSRPIACLLLHATAAGKGLHLFTSSLPAVAPQTVAVPWDEAQAPFVERSKQLNGELATAFNRSKIPVSSGHTWIRPLDNMQCPALAIEVAPAGEDETARDREYQTRIADAIAGAMLFWRGHADIVQSIVAPPPVVEPKPTPAKTEDGTAAPKAHPAIPAVVKPVLGAQTPATKPSHAGTSVPPKNAAPAGTPAAPIARAPRPVPSTVPPAVSSRPAPTPVRPADGSTPQ